uniref:Nucleic acid binding protein n=1 Tax=Garlic virus D TaxID=12430 RepID=U6BIN3_9VIRU|nr:nucleic acid binding protein [Garlic virus D]
MHPHDFNLLCCLHFSQPSLPKDLKELIFSHCVDCCKLVRKISQNKPFQGTSKCAKRRRAKRYNRCFDCGAFLVDGHRCKVFVSNAHSDVLAVIHEGPVKLYAERSYRPNSDAAQLIESDMLYIKALKL